MTVALLLLCFTAACYLDTPPNADFRLLCSSKLVLSFRHRMKVVSIQLPRVSEDLINLAMTVLEARECELWVATS